MLAASPQGSILLRSTALGRQKSTRSLAAAARLRVNTLQCRPRRAFLIQCSRHQVTWSTVSADEAMRLVQREGYKILDVRSAKDYDNSHITKPVRSSVSAPVVLNDNSTWNLDFAAAVACVAAKSSKLIVMCGDGRSLSQAALQQLSEGGYVGAVQLEGGYQGWSQVWSPSGKRRPPPGRWVSTGKEALKSGLNIPGVAESYDEGGNLTQARLAEGLKDGETLLPPMWQPDQR